MLQTTLLNRCPACGQGSIFRSWVQLHPTCPHCDARFERDPGSFLGAMAVAYGVAVLANALLGIWLFRQNFDTVTITVSVSLAAALTVLIIYRPVKAWWTWLLWRVGEVTRDDV